MSEAISSMSPGARAGTYQLPDPDAADRPDVPEISFRDLWSDNKVGFRFADLLDVVNPLQHLPVIGTLYRGLTGDEIGLGARMLGGALYGGPLGMAGSVMMAAADQALGGEPGAQVIAFLRDMFDGTSGAAGSQLAAVTPAAGTDTDAAVPTPRTASASLAPDAMGGEAETPGTPAAHAAAATAPGETVAPQPTALRSAPVVPAAPAREFPAHPRPSPIIRGRPLPLRPGPGGVRHAPTPVTQGTVDSESRRILASVEAARRAQAGLLLASIDPGVPLLPDTSDEKARETAAAGTDSVVAPSPFRHQGTVSSSIWTARAMEEALARYRKSQLLRRPAAADPAGAPLTLP